MTSLCWEDRNLFRVRTGLTIFCLFALVACTSPDRVFTDEDFQSMTRIELVSYLHDEYDCGEWGGHQESFEISRKGQTYEVVVKRDSSDCIRHKLNEKEARDSAATKSFVIGAEKKASIIRIVNELAYNKSKDAMWRLSNAQNSYVLKFQTPYRKVVIEAYFADESLIRYQAFRNELLK